MRSVVCLLILAAVVLAEPPVNLNPPSTSYGVPSNSYGPPTHTQALIRPNGNGNGRPSAQYGPPKPQYGPPAEEEEEEAPASYHFEYAVKDEESGNDFGHEESREGDVAQGKYYVLLPDGRKQVVEYTADNDGYKPKITYEEANGGGYPRGPANGNGNGHNGNGHNGNGHRGNGNGGYQY